MSGTQQTEALRLADKYEIEGFLQDHRFAKDHWCRQAAAELRRQHARIAELEAQLAATPVADAGNPALESDVSVALPEPAAWLATFTPKGMLSPHSIAGTNLEELKLLVPSASVFKPLYTRHVSQELEQFIEQVGDAHFHRCRVGSKEGVIRWDIEFGHYGDVVRGKTLRDAIT